MLSLWSGQCCSDVLSGDTRGDDDRSGLFPGLFRCLLHLWTSYSQHLITRGCIIIKKKNYRYSGESISYDPIPRYQTMNEMWNCLLMGFIYLMILIKLFFFYLFNITKIKSQDVFSSNKIEHILLLQKPRWWHFDTKEQ